MKGFHIVDHAPVDSGVLLSDGEGRLLVQFVEEDILRVRLAANGVFTEEPTFVVEEAPMTPIAVSVIQDGEKISVATGGACIEINQEPFGFRILANDGSPIVETAANALDYDQNRVIQRLQLAKDEGVYGLGQGNYPHLNLRDQERRMWHEWRGFRQSGPGGIPLMLSSRGYGILLNSSWPSRFAIGKAMPEGAPDPKRARYMAEPPWPHEEHSGEGNPEEIAIILDSGQFDSFFILRSGFGDILRGYRQLTGSSPLPPEWALGFIQCKNRYRSPEEILEVARGYRKRGIPADVLVIDWLWFKTFGDLTWDRATWANPKAMASELDSMGFKLMQAQHPFIDRGAVTWDEFSDKGYLVKFTPPEGSMVDHDSIFDFTNPDACKEWWEKIRLLYDDGIRGYWTDMGEPELHPKGCEHHWGSREQVHNIYSTLWVKTLYEGQRAYTNQRVFSLPRTAYAGIQRYAAALWSGDVSCTWEVFRDQVIIGQQVCMSGQPYWTTDIGGFMPIENYEPELYVRWVQWGMWCPIFRTHGTRAANEPWAFGSDAEAIITKHIRWRYELMPYVYTQAWHTHLTGEPMMRAMVMCYPDDPKAVEQELQFMFGPSFLVAPVVEQGERQQRVYLPEGLWYDYWTDEPITGSQEVLAFAPLERIPVYVKGGSIVPTAAPIQHTGDKARDVICVHVYPGADAKMDLYEDDGTTYGYEDGSYALTKLEYFENSRSVVINGSVGQYPGQPRTRAYQVIMHDQDTPKSVIINGMPTGQIENCSNGGCPSSGWHYCRDSRQLVITVPHTPVEDSVSIVMVSSDQDGTTPNHALALRQDTVRLGVDVSRPALRTAVVYAYVEGEMDDSKIRWEITPPLGWECRPSTVRTSSTLKGVIDTAWTLEATGEAFNPGSEVQVTARIKKLCGTERSFSTTVCLHSQYNTLWYVLGALPGEEGKAFNRVYPFENQELVDYAAKYEGAAGEPIGWKRNEMFDCFGYVDLRQAVDGGFGPLGYYLGYAAGEVWSPEERTVVFELLGEDRFKVWLNGELVVLANHRPAFRPIQVPVQLKAGWNTVLLKCTQDSTREWGGRSWGFYFRVLDEVGDLVKDVRYAACRPKRSRG
jgi:alpha-glucosidase